MAVWCSLFGVVQPGLLIRNCSCKYRSFVLNVEHMLPADALDKHALTGTAGLLPAKQSNHQQVVRFSLQPRVMQGSL